MEIKDILTQRRKELDLTMKQVANMVGVSEGTISRWESGKIADMRRDKIMTYANALKISPAIIMGWEECDNKEEPTRTLDDKTEKHLSTYISLNAERRAKVDAYTEEQLLVQRLEEKKGGSSAAKEA